VKLGRKIFIQTIEKAREERIFSEENLNVIDTFMIWRAASRQDTYTLIYQGIKMVLKFAGFYEMERKAGMHSIETIMIKNIRNRWQLELR
jgi:hypothetical protein